MFARSKPYNKLSLSLSIGLVCAFSPNIHAENTASQTLKPTPATEVPIESYRLSKAQGTTELRQLSESAQIELNAVQNTANTAQEAATQQATAPQGTTQQDIQQQSLPVPTTTQTNSPVPAEQDASSNADNTDANSTEIASGTGFADPNADEIENSTEGSSPIADTVQAEAVKNAEWTLDGLNNTGWVVGIEKGRLPVFAKIQVLLNRKHASPGAIDGATGMNTLKAISTYQTMNNLDATGKMDQQTWDSLNAGQSDPVFVEYTITEDDLKGPYADSIPSNYALQAKMKGLYYTRVTEMLGERFHMDENFLKQINPDASFKKAGETIIVANIRNNLPEDIHLIIAHKGAKQLYLFNSKNKMIASFPATIGSSDTPSPTGTHTVKNIAPNPWYGYSPKNFVQGNNMKPLSLPPGPNNPVGSMWIGLSKPSFGIHGTPNPSLISKTASHGCIRLTNWDAQDLAKRVKKGITVKFLE